MRRRFLERLEQRIESAPREHVHFVQEVHLEARAQGHVGGLLPQLADVIDAGVRRGVDLDEVHLGTRVGGDATLALAAGFDRRALLTVQRLGEQPGGGRLACPARAAEEVGSGFDMNPSPGNIRDGLITDAMKSAGAAKKGGASPINDVLDYTEYVKADGLSLLCTPGNDVESTTGLAGSGANVVLFTTGLGTPTGNPIVPVLKISSNSVLAKKMPSA